MLATSDSYFSLYFSMSDLSCAFCDQPEIRARTVIENDFAFAFPTNIPIVPGHLLIAPKRCTATFEELTPEEVADVFELVTKLRPVLVKTFGAEGFNFAWNEGKLSGQSVPHYHLHMLPRKEGDTGVLEYEPRKFLYRPGSREPTPEAELLEVSRVIRSFF